MNLVELLARESSRTAGQAGSRLPRLLSLLVLSCAGLRGVAVDDVVVRIRRVESRPSVVNPHVGGSVTLVAEAELGCRGRRVDCDLPPGTFYFEIQRSPTGPIVRRLEAESWSASPGRVTIRAVWGGKDGREAALEDGRYSYRMAFVDSRGRRLQLMPGKIAPIRISAVAPSTRRICRVAGKDSHNDPGARGTHNVLGTDLGFSVTTGGRTLIFFGDTWRPAGPPPPPDVAALYKLGDDAVASTKDPNPVDCLDLAFENLAGHYLPLRLVHPTEGARNLLSFRTPLAAFESLGSVYVFFILKDARVELGRPTADFPLGFESMGQLASPKFVNIAASAVAPARMGQRRLGAGFGEHPVFVWGRSTFVSVPFSDDRTYLLYLRGEELARGVLRPIYFAGLEAGRPVWSEDPRAAEPVIDKEAEPVTAQTSVIWSPQLEKWVMIYGGSLGFDPGWHRFSHGKTEKEVGIYMRFADQPWGSWSEPVTVLSPRTYPDLCALVFVPVRKGQPGCAEDSGYPPGKEGREYGAAFLEHYTQSVRTSAARFYWLLSVSNPYRVHLMETTIPVSLP